MAANILDLMRFVEFGEATVIPDLDDEVLMTFRMAQSVTQGVWLSGSACRGHWGP
jgi:hypothetical protein